MRKGWTAIVVLSLLVTGFAAFTPRPGSAQTPAEPEGPRVLPSQALILGVPFISFREAARLDYQDKNILNPSFAASLGMILKYWGQDLGLLKQADKALPKGPGGWGVVEQREGKSLADLKPFIARGIPVFVSPAITPVAHVLSPTVGLLAALRDLEFKFPEGGIYSGVLGRMVSLETFRQLETLTQTSPWESVLVSARVVIGYDDNRKVIILHDPSFGPAWEIGYDEFEKMWGATKRFYIVAHPPDYAEVLAKRSAAPPYSPRTPDQQAAVHFVFGYALASVGHVLGGEERFKKGLTIPGIGKGYQHLLLFELALHHGARGNKEEALATAQKATELVPEHHRPWEFIAQVYRSSFVEGWQQKAADAERKAQALCSEHEAQQQVAKVLARDFGIFGCSPWTMLWGGEQ